MSTPVPAIVLAAGASQRLGQPKQLLVYHGEFLIERAIRLANEAGASPVEGIASSIHAGLRTLDAVAGGASGVLILSCDQPRLTAGHLRGLIETFTAQAEPAIVASAYAGVHGVPAIFPRSMFADLLALRGDKGARSVLVHPPCPLIALPFIGGEVDIDQPGDLAQLE